MGLHDSLSLIFLESMKKTKITIVPHKLLFFVVINHGINSVSNTDQ